MESVAIARLILVLWRSVPLEPLGSPISRRAISAAEKSHSSLSPSPSSVLPFHPVVNSVQSLLVVVNMMDAYKWGHMYRPLPQGTDQELQRPEECPSKTGALVYFRGFFFRGHAASHIFVDRAEDSVLIVTQGQRDSLREIEDLLMLEFVA
jgi:hypothetical protein